MSMDPTAKTSRFAKYAESKKAARQARAAAAAAAAVAHAVPAASPEDWVRGFQAARILNVRPYDVAEIAARAGIRSRAIPGTARRYFVPDLIGLLKRTTEG